MVVSLLLWCFCMAALGLPNSAAADEPDLCVVDRLASSPFSARLMQRVPSSGCFSRRVSPRGQEVHVIRLSAPRDPLRRQARRSVTLTVFSPTDGSSHSREIILVLASSTPVDWTIHGHNGFLNGTSFQIIVTKRSQVVRCDLAPYSVKSQRVRGREALLKFVMTRLQAVTSLSAVGAADTIDLTVGIDLDAPDTCDTKVKSRRPSTSLAAHVSRPVPLLGCYHSHLAGFGPRDVYVVEVATESQSFWNSRVSVNLLPTADRKSAAGNLTLILKSAVPVTWELTSENFSGDLLVLTERPVKEARLGPAVTVETRFTRLPESFTALMLFAVKYSHGPPVAYVRAAAFNELDIRLNGGPGEAAPEDLPADDATRVPPGESTASDASHPALTDGAGSASGQLRRSVSVSCSGGRLTVAVPSAAAAAVSVSLLHLEDWGCVSHRNDTHLVVSGPLTQCGTSRRQTGEYVNTVHFVAAPLPEDDEDFEGSGAGAAGDVSASVGSASSWSWPQRTSGGSVPLSCTLPEQEDPNDDQDVTLDIDEVGASMYGLELAADPQFTRPIEPNVQLPVSDSIYIRATLFMASYLVPVVEQCWVSGAAAPASSAGSARVTLVDGACPARPSVSRLYGHDTAYRLQVTREFAALGPYYLHCRIGVCATPDSPARQHIVQCLEDPASHCSAAGVASQTSGRRLASGLQVLSRGPLFTSLPEDSSAESGEAAGRRPLPPLGVPHETVAGISIAAFLLGVLLMAGVWLIHTKIGPSKRHHFQAVPQNPGLDPVGAVSVVGNSGGSGASGNGAGGSGGGGQSANSTPNSQTPIIVSGRAAPPVGV